MSGPICADVCGVGASFWVENRVPSTEDLLIVLVDKNTRIDVGDLDVRGVTAGRDASASPDVTVTLTGSSVATDAGTESTVGAGASLTVTDGLAGGTWAVDGELILGDSASENTVSSHEIRVRAGGSFTVRGNSGPWGVSAPVVVEEGGVLDFATEGGPIYVHNVARIIVHGTVLINGEISSSEVLTLTGEGHVLARVGAPIDCYGTLMGDETAAVSDVNFTGPGASAHGVLATGDVHASRGARLSHLTGTLVSNRIDLDHAEVTVLKWQGSFVSTSSKAERLQLGGHSVFRGTHNVSVLEANRFGTTTVVVSEDSELEISASLTTFPGTSVVVGGTLVGGRSARLVFRGVSFGGTGTIVSHGWASFADLHLPLRLEGDGTYEVGGDVSLAEVAGGTFVVGEAGTASFLPAPMAHAVAEVGGQGELYIQSGANLVVSGDLTIDRLRLGTGHVDSAQLTVRGGQAALLSLLHTHGDATVHGLPLQLSGNSSMVGPSSCHGGRILFMGDSSLSIGDGHELILNASSLEAPTMAVDHGGRVVMTGPSSVHADVSLTGELVVSGRSTVAAVPNLDLNRGTIRMAGGRLDLSTLAPLTLYEDDMVYGVGRVEANVLNLAGVVHAEAAYEDTALTIRGFYNCEARDAVTRFVLRNREGSYGAMVMVVDEQMSFGGTLELVLEDLPDDRETMPLVYYTRHNSRFDDVVLFREGVPQPDADDNESVEQKLQLYTRLQYRDDELRLEIGRIPPDMPSADSAGGSGTGGDGTGGDSIYDLDNEEAAKAYISSGAAVAVIAAVIMVAIGGILFGYVVLQRTGRISSSSSAELLSPSAVSDRGIFLADDDDAAMV